jgi:hypothetical protein
MNNERLRDYIAERIEYELAPVNGASKPLARRIAEAVRSLIVNDTVRWTRDSGSESYPLESTMTRDELVKDLLQVTNLLFAERIADALNAALVVPKVPSHDWLQRARVAFAKDLYKRENQK